MNRTFFCKVIRIVFLEVGVPLASSDSRTRLKSGIRALLPKGARPGSRRARSRALLASRYLLRVHRLWIRSLQKLVRCYHTVWTPWKSSEANLDAPSLRECSSYVTKTGLRETGLREGPGPKRPLGCLRGNFGCLEGSLGCLRGPLGCRRGILGCLEGSLGSLSGTLGLRPFCFYRRKQFKENLISLLRCLYNKDNIVW